MPAVRLQVLALPLLLVAGMVLAACGGDGLEVGDEAPGFSLPDATGRTVSLDAYGGRPVLLYSHMADG